MAPMAESEVKSSGEEGGKSEEAGKGGEMIAIFSLCEFI